MRKVDDEVVLIPERFAIGDAWRWTHLTLLSSRLVNHLHPTVASLKPDPLICA